MKKVLKALLSVAMTAAAALLFVQCVRQEPVCTIHFDSSYEVSGEKYALDEINPDLPSDWSDYNYLSLEYRISTAQPFHIGLNTETGYNELRVLCYVPNAWNRIVIPLEYFSKTPGPKGSVVAHTHRTRDTGWINVGSGKRTPLVGIDTIGIRIKKPIDNPVMEVRSISLSVDDPGDLYMEKKPALDEFGQSNLVDFPEKIRSLEQLRAEWDAEDSEIVSSDEFNYSQFGGYRQRQVKATGFFRVENIDGKWWFVDPEGYLFLSVGVDCIRMEGGAVKNVDRRVELGMVRDLPPAELMEKYAPDKVKSGSASYSVWNLYRRYGDNLQEKFRENSVRRMTKWGINTMANWSSEDILRTDSKAFLLMLQNMGFPSDLMGLCDVYDPEFEGRIDKAVSDYVVRYRDDPWLIGYFIGNEPNWPNREVSLCGYILDGKDRPIKTALQKYLDKNGDTPDSRKNFVYDTFGTFLKVTVAALKRHDPNHMSFGIRFSNIAGVSDRLLKICGQYSDAISFNCYALAPNPKLLDRILSVTGRPMIIGEYHFGAVDRGMGSALWQVNSQEERGVAYSYYTEQGFSHPGLIGMAYFQWNDQDILGRGDGENYNCGLIDVTDRPYKEQTEAIAATAKRLYDIHSGNIPPTDRIPENARSLSILNLWNESGNTNF